VGIWVVALAIIAWIGRPAFIGTTSDLVPTDAIARPRPGRRLRPVHPDRETAAQARDLVPGLTSRGAILPPSTKGRSQASDW
jgi:hypothetical protein